MEWNFWDEVRREAETADVTVDNNGNLQEQRGSSLLAVTLSNGESVRMAHLVTFLPFLGGMRLSSYDEAAAVLLALSHLNHPGNSVVSPNNIHPNTCDLRFTTDLYDSLLNEIHSTAILNNLLRQSPPSAIIGAFRSAVTAPLSILGACTVYH